MSEASENLKRYLALFPEVPDHKSAMDRDAITEDVTFGDLRALLAERTWRPISEAPRTSDEVLLWWPARSSCPVGGRWSERFSLWRLWGDALVDRPFHGDGPTHFMPMPPPPEAAR